jgi:hypothetical protein
VIVCAYACTQDVAVPPLYYTAGAQSVVYAVRGSARLQVVDNIGAAVFDGELRRGQLLVVPEFFVVLTEAGKDGVEYIAFKNDASPVTSRIAGPAGRGHRRFVQCPGERRDEDQR